MPRESPLPRQVQTIIVDPAFTGWDESIVENVARDGILLWARRPLPAALAAVEARGTAAQAAR